MEEQTSQDKRLETVKERLREELVDDQGNPPDEDTVAHAVDMAAEPLADAPVQEFAPLLIEHGARDELRQQGLRRDVAEPETDGGVGTGDDVDGPDERRGEDMRTGQDTVHLASQQGVTPPPRPA